MASLPPELRRLIESGPLAHLSTTNADGSPQVSVIWIGIDGEHLVTAHMREQLKLRNIERDPRVVLSLEGPREPGVFLAPYAVVRARATIEGPSEDAWELLDRLAKVYVAPDADVPGPARRGLDRPLQRRARRRRGALGAGLKGLGQDPHPLVERALVEGRVAEDEPGRPCAGDAIGRQPVHAPGRAGRRRRTTAVSSTPSGR